jgi:hypothetical protein
MAIGRAVAALAIRRGVFNALTATFLVALVWGICKTPAWDGGLIAGAIVAASLAAFVGNFEHFESFKASPTAGIEARTRAVAERAEHAVTELHAVAELMGKWLVSLLAGEGRFAATQASKLDQKAELLKSLKSLGLADAALDRVDQADRSYAIIDYANYIARRVRKRIAYQRREDNTVATQKWTSYTNLKDESRPSPEEMHSRAQTLCDLDEETLTA